MKRFSQADLENLDKSDFEYLAGIKFDESALPEFDDLMARKNRREFIEHFASSRQILPRIAKRSNVDLGTLEETIDAHVSAELSKNESYWTANSDFLSIQKIARTSVTN